MRILNRRARYEYQILETFEAGISLTGSEVKSLKQGRASLSSSFARIREGEVWLMGANIPLFASSSPEGYDPLRERKLLLHKRQITALSLKVKQQQLTLVPMSLYTKGRLVKVKVALAKGKKRYEKRESKRRKDARREVEKALKNR
jgi:SsrA-binding protein